MSNRRGHAFEDDVFGERLPKWTVRTSLPPPRFELFLEQSAISTSREIRTSHSRFSSHLNARADVDVPSSFAYALREAGSSGSSSAALSVKDHDTTAVERQNDDLTLSNRDANVDTQEPSEPSFPSTPRQPSLSRKSSAVSDLEFDADTQERLRQLDFRYWARKEAKLDSLREGKSVSLVLEEEIATTTNCTENTHRHECLVNVGQYLDDQANHLLFLPAKDGWGRRTYYSDDELETEVDILLDASHSGHRVDCIRGVLQKLDSQIEDIPIENDSFGVDVLIRPIPVGLSSEIPIPGDLIEQELAIEDDLERGTRVHSSIHNTEQNLHPSNFVAAYQPPQPRSVLVLCGVDKAGASFFLQVLALFTIGFTVMLIYAVKKHDLGTGTGLCALIWTAGGVAHATYRKVFPPDEDDSSEREVELREVARRSA